MAATRARMPQVGTAQWILREKENAQTIIEQETEDLTFAAKSDLEWLNEHMAEIFSRNQKNMTDIFKTPGKLRGKTPRTARKRGVAENRAASLDWADVDPLTDIFAPNAKTVKSPANTAMFHKTFANRQSTDKAKQSPKASPNRHQYPPIKGKENTDSGYHDMPESQTTVRDDEMQVDQVQPNESAEQKNTQDDEIVEVQIIEEIQEDDAEAAVAKGAEHTDDQNMEVDELRSPSQTSSPEKPLLRKSSLTFASLPAREPLKKSVGNRTSYADQPRSTGVFSGNQNRNTLGNKSLGESQGALTMPNTNLDEDVDMYGDENLDPNTENTNSTKKHNESATQRLHDRINQLGQSKEPRPSKSIPPLAASLQFSQQHDSKADEAETHQTGRIQGFDGEYIVSSDDEDWIGPLQSPRLNEKIEPARPQLAKSISTDVMENIAGKSTISTFNQEQKTRSISANQPSTSPTKLIQEPASDIFQTGANTARGNAGRPMTASAVPAKENGPIAYPDPGSTENAFPSTTPAGSPSAKRHPDGPLSASKAKLYSVLKSARGIFASSAGVSAQAKMETLPPSAIRGHQQLQSIFDSPTRANATERLGLDQVNASPSKANEGRKTRSSTEREEKRKEKEAREQRMRDEELARVREQERVKAAAASQKLKATQQAAKTAKATKTSPTGSQEQPDGNMLPPGPSKSLLPSQTRDLRRPVKPTKESAPKVQPAPVSIRLPSQSKKIGQQSAMSSSQEQAASIPQSKNAGPGLKSSNTSLHSATSTNTLKSSTSAHAKPSSLQAAARKKEMEEKAAQRKAEAKRQMDQKRAAKQEEERRQEQERKAAEQQRLQEAKKTAQRQAAERRRQEEQRLEQQRLQLKQKHADELAAKLQQEKAQAQVSAPRADLGASRPIGRMNTIQNQKMRPIPQPPINPAKPAKRPQPDDEDESTLRPTMHRSGPSYQQSEAKRRKTESEDEDEETSEPRRSVNAPPIRHSNMRKDQPKLGQPYLGSTTTSQQPYTSMRQKLAEQQEQKKQQMLRMQQMQQSQTVNHPNDMAKFSNAKIPFAEIPNPPAGPSYSATMAANNNFYKTPARPGPSQMTANTGASTTRVPLRPEIPYESPKLPEIYTDSEDADSDASPFVPPSWTKSPALREQLLRQEHIDPETIFGPIPPFKIEEVFNDKPERFKKFRERTSSANWSGPDALTEEEKRRDRAARARIARDGGWSYWGSRMINDGLETPKEK
ncbi:MAG: hypothetical protein M1820_002251 [Bogoriella megaspora]|nr:MAG: hypothetical protein M1820_002251 [Bogoriella megaspora]